VLRLYPDGPPRLKWLCVSIQRESPAGFHSLTLHYRAHRQRLLAFELAGDPMLVSLPLVLGDVDEVLQYVPRHRFTFRVLRGGVPEIGKCVRTEDLEGAWRRLLAVWKAVQRSSATFSVAEPRRIDRARAAFYQAELCGDDVAARIDAGNGPALLRRAGGLHAQLHALEVPGTPGWDREELVPQVTEHVRLVSVFRDGRASSVQRALRFLLDTVPGPAPSAFCHGDLRCGHVLERDGHWSVIDLDGCRNGDPCQDVARFLAFLKRDVPYYRDSFADPRGGHEEYEAGVAAYLSGYSDSAGADLDPARLSWYLLAHELHFLARMFKRDLYDPIAFRRSEERVELLGEQLRGHLRGRRRP